MIFMKPENGEIPKMKIATKTSPEIADGHGSRIPGLKFTDMFNSGSNEVYGKGPLEPWRLATVYPANPTQLQLLKREQGNRCQSCGCELGRTKDDKANVVVLVRGNTRRQQLICGLCNVGFHTEALNHRKPPSTQKSG